MESALGVVPAGRPPGTATPPALTLDAHGALTPLLTSPAFTVPKALRERAESTCPGSPGPLPLPLPPEHLEAPPGVWLRHPGASDHDCCLSPR